VRIRKLEKGDLEIVSSICMEAFTDSVAPSLTSEGIETFGKISSVYGFSNRMEEDNIILVYEDKRRIIGVIELKEGRHLAMLFVDPNFQKKGVGRALISAISPYIKVEKMTVSASLNSVPAYLKYGFIYAGEPDEKVGLKYQPMELELNKALQRTNLSLLLIHPAQSYAAIRVYSW